ncbi:hypothetical protein GMORB2_5178 [Geosmithia morbida]|uniref:C3H1-type domain-containing protein n=1 Tax=Geosmithia morbida TaxID=1094350 RepID=A0A9P4YXW1_9HYPO|nr:uncharacterized protein GMORB2_5178 [Geosmithia morbida]KAF4124512.1 hypothetical protein GMORB2_5178 [Geosmithia morbida]
MSQHGYTHGPPEGRYHPQTTSNLPYPAYNAVPYYPSDAQTSSPFSHKNAPQQTFDNSGSVIPGLGLGFSNTGSAPAGWHQSWNSPSAAPGVHHQPPGAAPHGPRNIAHSVQAPEKNEEAEEGEVSEGEMEDIYEPKYSDEDTTTAHQNSSFGTIVTQETEGVSRNASPGTSQPSTAADSQPPPQPAAQDKSLAQARKQAQDAILRLWPLNVRFQDYINEGIDAPILQGLFRDVGLDPQATSTRSAPITDLPATTQPNAGQPPRKSQPSEMHKEAAVSVEEPTSRPVKNPAEERKDRIARLLAAKGTKQSAAASPDPTTQTSAAPSPTPPKLQSEKSKLLQEKMEALKRAREARTQKPVPGGGKEQHGENSSQNQDHKQPVKTAAISPSQDQAQVPQKPPEAQLPSFITGLALDAKPTPPTTNPQKRPVASDFIDTPGSPFKRPFGQNRKPAPFLIDVSDDDDDEAMDLDSPEQRPASVNRQNSTTNPPPSRGAYNTDDVRPVRSRSSPVVTTPVSLGGRINLESMNKEIEAMKRKIAEAEAKKKRKPSLRSSPATDRASASVTPSQGSEYGEASSQSPIDEAPRRLPKVAERRQRSDNKEASRSRSRAASERLPIIEAHRREQLLKLQTLQSQVKKMEQEIQESLQEEEKLRSEVIDESFSGDDETHELSGQASGTFLKPTKEDNAQGDAPAPAGMLEDGQQRPMESVTMGLHEPVERAKDDNKEDASANITGPSPSAAAPEEPQQTKQTTSDDEGSDGYEPPEAMSSTSSEDGDDKPGSEPSTTKGSHFLGESDSETQVVSATSPITKPISTGQQDSKPGSPREVVWDILPLEPAHRLTREQDQVQPKANEAPAPPAPSSTKFVPYETPLRYFRAYRFHPKFQQEVPGGLRSLTYSNKIDVNKELCPDDLAGVTCPRGSRCNYQHIESIQAPDDQVLLQLGAYGGYEGEREQEYIQGLRKLLTDFRSRKIKDFATISQGIIDYRAQFHKDPSKILPLGDVSI